MDEGMSGDPLPELEQQIRRLEAKENPSAQERERLHGLRAERERRLCDREGSRRLRCGAYRRPVKRAQGPKPRACSLTAIRNASPDGNESASQVAWESRKRFLDTWSAPS